MCDVKTAFPTVEDLHRHGPIDQDGIRVWSKPSDAIVARQRQPYEENGLELFNIVCGEAAF